MKRQFAINGEMSLNHTLAVYLIKIWLDYKQTQKALASCNFCYGEDDSLPRAPVIAMGTRVFLSCTLNNELIKGHCLIVPIQHYMNTLEGDDDVWDEIRVSLYFRWQIWMLICSSEFYEMSDAYVR